MDESSMSMNHALSSHLLESFEQSRRASTPAFGTQPADLVRHSYLPASHGNLSQISSLGNFSSVDQLAAMQAKLNKKLGPEFISQRPGPGGASKLTYAEGWKIINLANEVFGFNGWSSSVLSLTTDYIDYNEGAQRYNVGVSAVIRVTLRDGAFHEDVGFGSLENARGKGMALDKCKKEAVTDGIKRTLRNFGNVLGNCLYDKQYASEITKIKVPIPKLDKDALHRRPDLAGPVPNMPAPGFTPQPSSTSSPQDRAASTSTSRNVGKPSPLASSTPITNRTLPQNMPTPDTSLEVPRVVGVANGSVGRPLPQTNNVRRPQEQSRRPNPAPPSRASTSNVQRRASPVPATTTPALLLQREDSETSRIDHELAAEPPADGSMYGSEDDSFFDTVLPGELDLDVVETPVAPAPVESNHSASTKGKSPALEPEPKVTSQSGPEASTSTRIGPSSSGTTSNPETSTLARSTKLRLADAIRGGPPGQKATAGDKRVAVSEDTGQKRQRIS